MQKLSSTAEQQTKRERKDGTSSPAAGSFITKRSFSLLACEQLTYTVHSLTLLPQHDILIIHFSIWNQTLSGWWHLIRRHLHFDWWSSFDLVHLSPSWSSFVLTICSAVNRLSSISRFSFWASCQPSRGHTRTTPCQPTPAARFAKKS